MTLQRLVSICRDRRCSCAFWFVLPPNKQEVKQRRTPQPQSTNSTQHLFSARGSLCHHSLSNCLCGQLVPVAASRQPAFVLKSLDLLWTCWARPRSSANLILSWKPALGVRFQDELQDPRLLVSQWCLASAMKRTLLAELGTSVNGFRSTSWAVHVSPSLPPRQISSGIRPIARNSSYCTSFLASSAPSAVTRIFLFGNPERFRLSQIITLNV